MTVTYWQF